MLSSIFFDVIVFLLSNLVTGSSSIKMSLLVLELLDFSFIRDWPEIQKPEIPPSEPCQTYGDWFKLGIPNKSKMFLMKCYCMLQNARVVAFTVFALLKTNQQGGGKITPRD